MPQPELVISDTPTATESVEVQPASHSRTRLAIASGATAAALFLAGCGESSSTNVVEMAEAADSTNNADYKNEPPTSVVVTHNSTSPTPMIVTRSAESRPATAPGAEYVTMYGQELLVPAGLTGQALLDTLAYNYGVIWNYLDESVSPTEQLRRAMEMMRMVNLSDRVDSLYVTNLGIDLKRAIDYHRGDPLQERTIIHFNLSGPNAWQESSNGTATARITALDNRGTNAPRLMTLKREPATTADGKTATAWQIVNVAPL